MKQRTCVECESHYYGYGSQVVCSEACRNARDVKQRKARYKAVKIDRRSCDRCGTDYQPIANHQRFCNPECGREADLERRRGAPTRPCSKCGKPGCPTRPGIAVCDACRVDGRYRPEMEQRRRLRKYGLTQDIYDAMWAAQGHRCAICRTNRPGGKGWCIDHCHDSDVVRGILCNNCNSGLGLFKDDANTLRAAAVYAARHAHLRLVN